MSFGWEGRTVRLVPLDKERHFDNCVRWLNDPQVTAHTIVGDFPLTRIAEERFFERQMHASTKSTELTFAIETLAEHAEHIGVTGLMHIDYRHGTAVTGTIIGRKKLWNRGYGSDAITVRTRYAFETLNLRLLLSEIMADNAGSLRAVQKVGYREVGRIPQRWWKRGSYRECILLALSREDWQAAPAHESAAGT